MPVKSVFTVIVLCCLASQPAFAQRDEFCDGFEEGWKTVKGSLTIVPICPVAPVTPVGSTAYREGLKAGVRAGRKAGGGSSGGAGDYRHSREDFCAGFGEGWKAIKGNLTIVPVCPVPPITPIGSTPYREGIKAGMAKARGS